MLSVAWKMAVPVSNNNDLNSDLVDFLKRNYPDIVVTEDKGDFVSSIKAETGSCRLRIAGLSFDGSTWDLAKHLATGADQLFVVFRGRVYTQQPILLTVIYTLWSEVLRKFGLTKQTAPVIAVSASSSCNAERLPWSEVRGVGGVS
jgi:hypothetical protein